MGLNPGELPKLLIALQTVCLEANEQAINSFINKDMTLAENVRKTQTKIQDIYANIEKVTKNQPVDVIPQFLAAISFVRQIYEHSLDMADLVA
jgi:predicted DNA-binding protein YlxM (UPF0122 family)